MFHGVIGDIWLDISHNDMRPLAPLHFMVINAPHGPDDAGLRYRWLCHFTNDHYAASSPSIWPSFQQHYPAMVQELGDQIQQLFGETMQDAVWRFCRNRSLYGKKGHKTHMGRFGAVFHDVNTPVKLEQRVV